MGQKVVDPQSTNTEDSVHIDNTVQSDLTSEEISLPSDFVSVDGRRVYDCPASEPVLSNKRTIAFNIDIYMHLIR